MKLAARTIFASALVIFALLAPAGSRVQAAGNLTIAAASSLRYVLPDIVRGFERQYPQARIEVIYGSSGKMRTQIVNGAPFDLFLSADMAYPQSLVDQGMTTGQVQVFALGRLAIWSLRRNVEGLDVGDLLAPSFKRIAIANPVHAPYGLAARQALQSRGVWGPLYARFVFGENIGQTAHFVLSGAVDAGLIAFSLILSPGMTGKGSHTLIPAELHKPIRHGLVIIRHKTQKPVARAFAGHLLSSAVHAILQRYGFEKPELSHADQP